MHVPEITVLLGISLHLAGGIVGRENAVGRCEIPTVPLSILCAEFATCTNNRKL